VRVSLDDGGVGRGLPEATWSNRSDFWIKRGFRLRKAGARPDTEAAHREWNDYVHARRSTRVPKRPVADLLIGGFALSRAGVITRNAADFRRWFPKLVIHEP